MTADELAAAIHRFEKWKHFSGTESHRFRGRSQFEQDLRERVEQRPELGVRLIELLTPKHDDDTVASILSWLPIHQAEDADELTPVDFTTLIGAMIERGFVGRKLHDAVGRLVYDLATTDIGIPSEVVSILSGWLKCDPVSGTSEATNEEECYIEKAWKNGDPRPILWGLKNGDFIPEEFFWIGEAIKLVEYNQSDKGDAISWGELMLDCVEREFDDRLWRSWLFAAYRYVPDRAVFATVLTKLLQERPHLICTLETYYALSRTSPWLSGETRLHVLRIMNDSSLQSAKQAAGELATIFAIHDGDTQCEELVERAVSQLQDPENEQFLTGVVYSAGVLFSQPKYRLAAGQRLESLCPTRLPQVTSAYSLAFRHDESLANDASTVNLLTSMNVAFQFDNFEHTYGFPEALWGITDTDPLLVLQLCQKLVNAERGSRERGGGKYRLGLSEETLVKIATTLHRSSDKQIREEALTLFEDLQEIEATGVSRHLREIDGRLP